ncbi:trichohyalin-like [Siniperca chuatsi]|uniref:trichohyalin-like n=1 Tax=Siniperca chuatsi TaxID=119488 RepID=UPI001CE06CE5|nr:trichohyalin-like [Siniperca chuatsi]
MMKGQKSSLLTEMELVRSKMKLTTQERKEEARRQMHVELKAMEMERRKRVALETMEKCKREREEKEKATESLRRQKEKIQEERMRQEAKQREEMRANEQKALEKKKQDQLKRLQWEKVMMVEEELVRRPRYTLSALKKEQRREEAELCRQPKVGDKAGPERLTSDLKAEEQGKKKTLHNNWVGEQSTDSEPVKEKFHPNSSTYLLFAAKPGPKPEEKPKTPKSNETLQWLQGRLKVGHWVDKYRDHRARKDEKRKRKAEEQYAKWTAFKASLYEPILPAE